MFFLLGGRGALYILSTNNNKCAEKYLSGCLWDDTPNPRLADEKCTRRPGRDGPVTIEGRRALQGQFPRDSPFEGTRETMEEGLQDFSYWGVEQVMKEGHRS